MTRTPARKLTIFVDENDKHGSKPVYEAVLDLCFRNRISGASVFRGIEGYGKDRVFHSAKILELSTTLPVKIEIVDSVEAIEAVIPKIEEIVTRGLIEITDVQILK